MTELLERRHAVDNAVTAVVVLGIEAVHGSLTISDFQVAVQRLERAIRPWDTVVDVAPRTVGVICHSLSSLREVDAIAARLAEVVRAPMAVGEDVRQVGACVGSAAVADGEGTEAALARARDAMRRMREARRSLVVPPPR
ncbi:MAG TPA: hypothetical protein VGX28_16240 [Frankiaceae bacterium]|jgi:GGDEF domain-containing protein|nr:hypothetical protein [Frankiaceae bacterium]